MDLILWCLTLVGPSGLPLEMKLRAPSEQIALDRARQWKPDHEVREIRHEAYQPPEAA